LRTFFFFDVVGFCSATLAGLGEFVRKGSVIFVNDRVDRALDMFENTCCNKDKQVVNTMSAECTYSTYLPITFYLPFTLHINIACDCLDYGQITDHCVLLVL
jgi:uncharacterized protein YaaQ